MLYQLPELLKYKNIIHSFSTREFGNMSWRWGEQEEVKNNRVKFLAELHLNPTSGVTSELIHQAEIVRVDKDSTGFGILQPDYKIKADGLITNDPQIFLIQVVADCAPIILFDSEHKAIGFAHSGWRGTSLHIPEKIVSAMIEEFNSNPTQLIIGIGPCIQECCYIYDNPQQKNYPGWEPYLRKDAENNFHINNFQFIIDQLLSTGINPKNINTSAECSGHSSKFFSNYRDKKNGVSQEKRFAAVIGLN